FGLALVEPARHPFRLLGLGALSMEQVDGAVKLEQDPPQGLQFIGKLGSELKWNWTDAPIMAGKETFTGHAIAHETSAISVGEGGVGYDFRKHKALERSGANLAVADADPLIAGEFLESHGSARSDLVGADADFGAHAVF